MQRALPIASSLLRPLPAYYYPAKGMKFAGHQMPPSTHRSRALAPWASGPLVRPPADEAITNQGANDKSVFTADGMALKALKLAPTSVAIGTFPLGAYAGLQIGHCQPIDRGTADCHFPGNPAFPDRILRLVVFDMLLSNFPTVTYSHGSSSGQSRQCSLLRSTRSAPLTRVARRRPHSLSAKLWKEQTL